VSNIQIRLPTGDVANFQVKRVRRGWVVTRGELHSHFSDSNGCQHCLSFIIAGVLPNNPYYVTAVRRLLTEDEFKSMRIPKTKQRYINSVRGVK
jgi:hypothetical protein